MVTTDLQYLQIDLLHAYIHDLQELVFIDKYFLVIIYIPKSVRFDEYSGLTELISVAQILCTMTYW